MKILCIRKKHIVLVFCAVLLISFGVFCVVQVSSTPKTNYTIVIDAGHGGVDVKLGQYEIF